MLGSNKKKRKGSASPTRDAVAKRKRDEPKHTTKPSTQAPPRAQSSTLSDHAALPSNDDWVFRIKVISSSTAPDEDIFRGAVQGLVKICFPQGVLEEMEVDVVKQHMREGKAPEESIARMADTYGMEMVQRITEMLAEYLDTPAKVESAVKSIIATSSNLHIEVGDEVSADIARSLAHQGRQESVTQNEVAATVELDHSPQNITKKRKNKAGEYSRKHGGDGMLVDAEEPTQGSETTQQTPDGEGHGPKKIHYSWRWNIDPDGASAEALTEAFQQPADLFAFHALPIVKGMLEADAKRKELRHKMQNMLDEMPDDEYEKWVESLRKLHDGDEVMLVRIPTDSVFTSRTAATPAPIDSRRRPEDKTVVSRGAGCGQTQSDAPPKPLQLNQSIKLESKAASNTLRNDTQNEAMQSKLDVATTTTAFRHPSNEERDLGSLARNSRLFHTSQLTAGQQTGATLAFTPILNLIWGHTSFDHSNQSLVVKAIMESFRKRVAPGSLYVQSSDGYVSPLSLPVMETRLLDSQWPKAARRGDTVKARIWQEERLVPYVVANLSAFPELLAEPFVFVNLRPSTTCILDVIFDPHRPMISNNTVAAKVDTAPKTGNEIRMAVNATIDLIARDLKRRGLDIKVLTNGPYEIGLDQQLRGILYTTSTSESEKRVITDKTMRPAVFDHRDRFPELKSSLLVKTWERETGQKW